MGPCGRGPHLPRVRLPRATCLPRIAAGEGLGRPCSEATNHHWGKAERVPSSLVYRHTQPRSATSLQRSSARRSRPQSCGEAPSVSPAAPHGLSHREPLRRVCRDDSCTRTCEGVSLCGKITPNERRRLVEGLVLPFSCGGTQKAASGPETQLPSPDADLRFL